MLTGTEDPEQYHQQESGVVFASPCSSIGSTPA
jgi:hypothetical protein